MGSLNLSQMWCFLFLHLEKKVLKTDFDYVTNQILFYEME